METRVALPILFLLVGFGLSMKDISPQVVQKFRERIKHLDLNNTKHTSDIHLKRWINYYQNDLKKASELFERHLQWRKNNKIDELSTWKAPSFVRKRYKYEIIGKTPGGNPVLYWPMGAWDLELGIESGYQKDGIKQILKMFEETMSDMGKDVGQFLFLIDFEKLELRQILNLRVMRNAIDIARVLEENYPVVSYHAMIYKAPPIFSLVFNVLKPFLSAPTLEVVDIYGTHQNENWKKDMLKLIPQELFDKIPGSSDPVNSDESQEDEEEEERSGIQFKDGTTLIPDEFETTTTYPDEGAEDNEIHSISKEINLKRGELLRVDHPRCKGRHIMLWSSKLVNAEEDSAPGKNGTIAKFRILFDSPEDKFTYHESNLSEGYSVGVIICDEGENYTFEYDNTNGTQDVGPIQFRLDWMKDEFHKLFP